MLARGLLCRLAADVPKTSTHDLPRLARLLQSSLPACHALSAPAARALSRAYHTALSNSRRSYATAAAAAKTTRATKPTARVTKDVKKAAAAKKPASRAAAAKKTTAKKAPAKKAARKPAAKKAKPKKKAAAKPARRRKAPSPEAVKKQQIKELKEAALQEPVTRIGPTGWTVFAAEALVGNKLGAKGELLREAGVKYRQLTPAEKEHYNHLANERKADVRAKYTAWVHSHTPEQIRLANNARAILRRRLASGEAARIDIAKLHKIVDDRQVKRPLTGYTRFATERKTSGDFKGIKPTEAFSLIGKEWRALSASEKQKYKDEFTASLPAYTREKQNTLGHT